MIRYLIFVAILACLAASAHAAVYYVDKGSSATAPDGTSWAKAYRTIGDAIDAAAAAKANGDHEIWVASGVYNELVSMEDGIDLYGGFAGGEANRSARDWNVNFTYIDGEGSRQCVYGATGAVLDGFIIYDGFSTSNGNGAGLININASPTVRNCYFMGNHGGFGGAVYNANSQPRFENCIFYGNEGRHGAVMYNTQSTANIVNCTAIGNTLTQDSHAVVNINTSVIITNTILWGNEGGSMLNGIGSLANVFTSNIAMEDDEEVYPGTDNINADPLFFDIENGDFRLSPDSPCVNTGSNVGLTPTVDYRGVPRPQGSAIDIGAYEYLANDPTDTDGDGIPDNEEDLIDPDQDGIPNYLDNDSDGDGIDDVLEGAGDADGDNIPNYLDRDADGNGLLDGDEGSGDADGNGIPNFLDMDNDGDGIPDFVEGTLDIDGDNTPNLNDTDSDGDGMDDAVEGVGDPDGDGIPNFLDLDSDGDGVSDHDEGFDDDDNDGIPGYLDDRDDFPYVDEDVNGDGTITAVDIQLVINALLDI